MRRLCVTIGTRPSTFGRCACEDVECCTLYMVKLSAGCQVPRIVIEGRFSDSEMVIVCP
jgi:hypothetical protein